MRTLILVLSTSLFFIGFLRAQSGCTDLQATNYDASATLNDGSCTYAETNYMLGQIAELPDQLIENSGLVHLPEGLYTLNDAGNANEIYKIDSMDGSVLQTLLVIGDNKDWEDMAESDTHIFLGDFGNNDGDRTDLRIYKIDKTELGNNVLNAQPINFSFADQIDFSENNNNHDFDCEAFFFHDDSLHLFTKNWADNQTRHYTISTETGVLHTVLPKFTFDVGGLITSADINEEGTVALLGYTEVGLNFMWLLYDYKDNSFFSGNKRRIELGSGLVNSQTEAITFKDNNNGYISSEQFDLGQIELPPRLMCFTIDQWVTWPIMVSTTDVSMLNMAIKTFPNPFGQELNLTLSENWPKSQTELRLFDTNGQLLLSREYDGSLAGEQLTLEGLNHLPPGVYMIQAISDGYFWQGKVAK